MLVKGFAAFLLVALGQAGPVKCMCWSPGEREWVPCDSISTYRSTRTITLSSTLTKSFPPSTPTGFRSIDSSVSGGVGTPTYTSSYPPPASSSSTLWSISSSVSAGSSCPVVSPSALTLTTTRYYGTPAPPSIVTVTTTSIKTSVKTSILATPPTTVTWTATVLSTRTIHSPYTIYLTTTTTTAALWPTPPLCAPCGPSSWKTTIVSTETAYTSTTTTLPTPTPSGSTVSSVEGLTSTPTPARTSAVGPPFSTWSTETPSYGFPTYAAPPGPMFSMARGEEGWEKKVVQ
ncbi:hypothetical protein BKA80DRAFT_330986 [Phyllosticta citrichinensis]